MKRGEKLLCLALNCPQRCPCNPHSLDSCHSLTKTTGISSIVLTNTSQPLRARLLSLSFLGCGTNLFLNFISKSFLERKCSVVASPLWSFCLFSNVASDIYDIFDRLHFGRMSDSTVFYTQRFFSLSLLTRLLLKFLSA